MADVIKFRTTYKNYEEADRWAEMAELSKPPLPNFKHKAENLLSGLAILACVVLISYLALRSM
jgi:hypothetical protein